MPDNVHMRARADGSFRILQVTDLHNDVNAHAAEGTYSLIRALVDHAKPDLIAVTGDNWCGDDMPEEAPALMERDIAFFEALGLPWALILGNHDYVASMDVLHRRLYACKHAVTPEGDGRGAFRVEVRARGAASPSWDLFFLNSGAAWQPETDTRFLVEESARLREERGVVAPACVFVHIPLKEFETARLDGTAVGIAQEEVLHWGDEGDVFEAFRATGAVRACFVGHSHTNDYHLVKDGIVLAYGRATGLGGYGNERLAKGGKVIDLLPGGAFAFHTLFADGGTWQPVAFGGA